MALEIPDFGNIPKRHFSGGSHLASPDGAHLELILNSAGVKSQHGPVRVALDGTLTHSYLWLGVTVRLAEIHSVLSGALLTGDATVTVSIGGVAVTDGVLTITQVASAAGDLDSATPSALNVVNYGDVIEFTVGGTNTAAVFADLTFLVRAPS